MYIPNRHLNEQISHFVILVLINFFIGSCQKKNDIEPIINDYTGTYPSIVYNEALLCELTPGVYEENIIPSDVKQLEYGRIEIDFRYDGGALTSFMSLFYYGSINNNSQDDLVEKTQFHLAIEIGHYNVIPQPVEFLFYTISTFRQPQYCRDTYIPMISGKTYKAVFDKRPEGMILQLKQGDSVLNIFPHAFFPDSTQLFFKDVTSYIDRNKGDSLKKVMMVGQGFAGFDVGNHTFNGNISGVRIYKYSISSQTVIYEIQNLRNQVTENQEIKFIPRDKLADSKNYIEIQYEFWPYKFESGVFIPDGTKKTGISERYKNNQEVIHTLGSSEIGFYKLTLKTLTENGTVVGTSQKPYEVWVYPKDWSFKFY